MFFAERIKNIKPGDKVLEIGPGSTPHPRSDVFLEKIYTDMDEFRMQRGNMPEFVTDKKVVHYQGDVFPFADKEFDYVICSHVLEHVPDAEIFLEEVFRVGKRGYLEFPTIYYDYLYNFPVHTLFLLYEDNVIKWMKKSESQLAVFSEVQYLFHQSLLKEHYGLVDSLKEYFFQGFEWENEVKRKKVASLIDVCYRRQDIMLKQVIPPKKKISTYNRIKHEVKKRLPFKT